MSNKKGMSEDDLVKLYFLSNQKPPVKAQTISEELGVPLGTVHFAKNNIRRHWYIPDENTTYGRAVLKIKALKKQMRESKNEPMEETQTTKFLPPPAPSSEPTTVDVVSSVQALVNENKRLRAKLAKIMELAGSDLDK